MADTTYRERLAAATVLVDHPDFVRVAIGEATPLELDLADAAALAASLKRAVAHAKARA